MKKIYNPRYPIRALELYCKKANAKTLRKLALSIGAKQGNCKTQCTKLILRQGGILERLRNIKERKGSVSIIAIDTGISNFSFTKFELEHKRPTYSDRGLININYNPQNAIEYDRTAEELPLLLEWKKFHIAQAFGGIMDKHFSPTPEIMSQLAYNITEYIKNEIKGADLYILERQRLRTMSSKSVLEPVIKSNILEHIIYSNLKNKPFSTQDLWKCNLEIENHHDDESHVISSDPQRMVSYWCDYTYLAPLKNVVNSVKSSVDMASIIPPKNIKVSNPKVSKTIRIELVKRILQTAMKAKSLGKIGNDSLSETERRCNPLLVQLNDEWYNRIQPVIKENKKYKLYDCIKIDRPAGVRKDDDLADSFLHGLAWMQWLKTYEEVQDIIYRDLGRYDQTILADFNSYVKMKTINMTQYQKGTLIGVDSFENEPSIKELQEEEDLINKLKKLQFTY
ncbi:hypothetical protein TBLA_0C00910 [Henningerozyma blattae CBS 6284]|uniref:Mitochondrial resolvase Ydc2 catalytic domain-containing protein n=1 Tax=Henningerozyma blattae (strain ATCC 34711 / CBS 6284 / DSM 70876 / NBRC 10599 / NRRL Y-10934 / UCD 77-7) TaxID=1071380 RepID=I2H0K4_HENB6|nr:hypothetical protein TBLA_0C00910 [Tetrapisispora blattae CBS 6284]CCH59906.1 hypothetical protein TBLA_0C00910 [Tetrapisispora blattae CBS 6284]